MVVAGALVAVLVISIAALVLRRGGGDTPAPQQQQPPQQQQAQTPAPGQPPATPPKQDSTPDPNATAATPPVDAAPAASALTSVTIDLRPWARVKIVPAAPDPSVPADALYSPFTLDLPAGTYTLECENGGVTRPTTIQLTVVEGTPFAASAEAR